MLNIMPTMNINSNQSSRMAPGRSSWATRTALAMFASILLAAADAPTDHATAQIRDYHFDKTISRSVLENYLSRAISMEGLLEHFT